MEKLLRNRNILITAGSTWVALDKVRIITNVFTGRTGYEITCKALEMGANVTLLLGGGRLKIDKNIGRSKRLKVIEFKYFDELHSLIRKELKTKRYDAVVHSAAVSDYAPTKHVKGKIRSKKKSLTIRLKPTPKIIDEIKKLNPGVTLVKFKLEYKMPRAKLLNIAYKSMQDSKADFIVANTLEDFANRRKAYIIDRNKVITDTHGVKKLSSTLLRNISQKV